jgi:hypothetical protein
MADRLSGFLSQITPFSKPEQYPVIPYGKGERVIQFMISPPNSKGMIMVQTFPDLMDGGKPITLSVKKSLIIKRWHKPQR